MSFHHFSIILAGSCSAFATLVIFVLLYIHATRLSRPNEQIKYVRYYSRIRRHSNPLDHRIMKIGLLIPFYSILSLLSIAFPKAHVDIAPWLDLVQSVALGSFFLLLCEFVSESPSQREVFFAALVIPNKKSPSGQSGGLLWYRVCLLSTQLHRSSS